MADYNLKVITADTDGPSADTELLFGSPDQSSGTPKPYSFAGVKTWIQGWSASSFGAPVNRFYAYTDCLIAAANSIGDGNYFHFFAGTGTATSSIASGSGTLGVLSLDLGTTTAGRCAIAAASSVSGVNIRFGFGQTSFQAKVAIHVLSNGTDTYSTRVGFIDSITGESVDGAFFRYTHSVNSGKWEAVTRSNSVETAADTGVTAAVDVFQKFKIVMNAAGTSCVFSIDGATVATNTANIPTAAGRETSFGVMALKTVGTTATSGAYVDFIETEVLFTSAR